MAVERRVLAGVAILPLLGLAVLAGCGSDRSSAPPPVPGGDQEVSLNDPDGGFTPTDELPGFGDPDLLASVGGEQEFEDPVADDPEVSDMDRRPMARVYAMTILWGMLQAQGPDSSRSAGASDGDLYDWSGSLRVTRGAIVVRSLVAFEPEDSIRRPRPDRRTVEWVSHTGDGLDGLRLLIHQSPRAPGLADDSLTFVTPLCTRSFALRDLQKLDELVTVDAAGNRVSFRAFLVRPALHLHGFLRGRWARIPEGDSVGRFSGLWIGSRGEVGGFVRGHYGVNDAGVKVFFGKYVDRAGRFGGILHGIWDVTTADAEPRGSGGWFRGTWASDGRTVVGTLSGRWHAPVGRPGFFEGRWCEGCVEGEEDPPPAEPGAASGS